MKNLNKIIVFPMFLTALTSALSIQIWAEAFPKIELYGIGNASVCLCGFITAFNFGRFAYYLFCAVVIAVAVLAVIAIRKNIMWVAVICVAGYFADLCFSVFLKINTPSITPIFSYIFDPVMLILFTLYFIGIFKEKKTAINRSEDLTYLQDFCECQSKKQPAKTDEVE